MKLSDNNFIPENIISMYIYFIKHLRYPLIIEDYKQKYIWNEAIVESGVTKEEKRGIGLMYDYISAYDFNKGFPNIFIEALKLHELLYSQCPHPEFGGRLREEDVYLKDDPYDVPSSDIARSMFNTYITRNIVCNNEEDVFTYIDECIKTNIDLIKLQPFQDGNKRTLRGLLNLQLACIGIPPIYIKKSERIEYMLRLREAILSNKYTELMRFYYYKICDAIVEMDIERVDTIPSISESKKFVIERGTK